MTAVQYRDQGESSTDEDHEITTCAAHNMLHMESTCHVHHCTWSLSQIWKRASKFRGWSLVKRGAKTAYFRVVLRGHRVRLYRRQMTGQWINLLS